MKLASLIIGIISLVGMLIGFIPCLGWFNWLVIILALTGLILGIVDYYSAPDDYNSNLNETYNNYNKPFPTGALICGIALALSTVRLIIGGGII